jgi:hypothetical protein
MSRRSAFMSVSCSRSNSPSKTLLDGKDSGFVRAAIRGLHS